MRFVTVMDNKPSEHHGLINEHGLSFYIDTGNTKILFDFGANHHALENALKLNIPLNEIEYAIGSHGHYDHVGGYPDFVMAGLTCPLITGKDFFLEKYAGDSNVATYLGSGFDIRFLEKNDIQYYQCNGLLKLSDDCYVINNFNRSYDFEKIPDRFTILKNGHLEKDNFSDEICLVVKRQDYVVVVVGCSHPGILNILTSVKQRFDLPIRCVIGGTHLVEANQSRINQTIQIMKSYGISLIGFNHCSGNLLQETMETAKDLNSVYLSVGKSIFFD